MCCSLIGAQIFQISYQLDNEIKAIHEKTRNIIVKEIKNTKDSFAIKIPRIVKSFSVDKGTKSPSFDSIKTTSFKEVNKSFPNNITAFDKAPDESIYYKTINNQKFLLYKDKEVIFFQSEDQARIQAKEGNLVRLFIHHHIFYTNYLLYMFMMKLIIPFIQLHFSLMKNKTTDDYYKILKKLDINVNQYLPINDNYEINQLLTDLELTIGAAAKKIYKNITLKYCNWHLLHAMKKK